MGFWNLNYLEEKMSNEAFKREVSKCDITGGDCNSKLGTQADSVI